MVCHREKKEVLIENIYDRQRKVAEQRKNLEDVLVRAHIEAKFAIDKGASPQQMKKTQKFIRQAQWRWDFIAASHGASFHAPVECLRIIASGIEKAAQARLENARVLASLGYNKEVPIPDISTKEKAQRYIGLDPKKMREEKDTWKTKVLPTWLKKAEEREKKMPLPKRIG
jgi:nitrite reductase (cytochrome c-552)